MVSPPEERRALEDVYGVPFDEHGWPKELSAVSDLAGATSAFRYSAAGAQGAPISQVQSHAPEVAGGRLTPHCQRAMRPQSRPPWFASEVRTTALDALFVASFVLDGRGSIKQCNDAAAALLKDPAACNVRLGRLLSIGVKCSPSISEALTACSSINPVRIAAYLRTQGQVVPCTLFTLQGDFGDKGVSTDYPQRFLLLVEVPRANGREVAKSVAALFKLTPAEVRVLGELLIGSSPAAAADACKSSVATVRTQMCSIFAKAGVSSQTDLLLLLRAMRF